MASSAQLLATVTALETAAGGATSANSSPTGYWKRIAAAAETLAGASTAANSLVEGYMLRTAIALEAVSGVSTSTANRNERGLMLRIVNALEAQGDVGTGSLDHRLVLAAEGASFGPPFVDLTLDNDTIPETAVTETVVGTLAGYQPSGFVVRVLTQSNAGWFYYDGISIFVDDPILDFETNPSPTITLREHVFDEVDPLNPVGPYHDTVLTIHVTDVVEPITTGWKAFSTFANVAIGAGPAWSNPGNAAASDDSYATCVMTSTVSQELRATGADFSEIPDGATIVGVEVRLEGNDTGTGIINFAFLINGNAGSSADRIGTDEISAGRTNSWSPASTSDEQVIIGGPATTWEAALTSAIVKGANFGVGIGGSRSVSGSPTFSIDAIEMRISYTV